MRVRFIAVTALVAGLLMVASSSSQATHHLWRFSQIFSARGGDVQYIQLFVTADNEANVGAFGVTSSAGNSFSFVNNLPSTTTANTWILIGTANLPKFGGPVPDYIIPSNFFSSGGGTLTYATTIDTWSYGAMPTDGSHSLMRDGSTPVNSAVNFAGQAAVVSAPPVATVPAATGWSLALLIGVLLVVGSGLLRKRMTGLQRPAV
jgi:hypothetical protein